MGELTGRLSTKAAIELAKRQLAELEAMTEEEYEAKQQQAEAERLRVIEARKNRVQNATGGRARARELGLTGADIPKCTGVKKDGTQCSNQAGQGTDHFGFGKCKYHGGCSQGMMTHGRYSQIKNEGLRHLVEHFVEDDDILNTVQDIALCRALVHRYIDDYDHWLEMMEAWWADHEAGRIGPEKPRKLLELTDCYRLLDSLTKAVERENKRRQNTAISQIHLFRIINAIGDVITKHVHDEEVLKAIREEMLTIRMPVQFRG